MTKMLNNVLVHLFMFLALHFFIRSLWHTWLLFLKRLKHHLPLKATNCSYTQRSVPGRKYFRQQTLSKYAWKQQVCPLPEVYLEKNPPVIYLFMFLTTWCYGFGEWLHSFLHIHLTTKRSPVCFRKETQIPFVSSGIKICQIKHRALPAVVTALWLREQPKVMCGITFTL